MRLWHVIDLRCQGPSVDLIYHALHAKGNPLRLHAAAGIASRRLEVLYPYQQSWG
jgi:hypothetical protein